MAKGKKGNNTAGRVKVNSYRTLNGKTVKPVLYVSTHIGHGTYMAGSVDGEMVVGPNGKPTPYKQITSS